MDCSSVDVHVHLMQSNTHSTIRFSKIALRLEINKIVKKMLDWMYV